MLWKWASSEDYFQVTCMDSVGTFCGNWKTKMLIPKMKFDYIYAIHVHCEGLFQAFCCLKIIIFKCFFFFWYVFYPPVESSCGNCLHSTVQFASLKTCIKYSDTLIFRLCHHYRWYLDIHFYNVFSESKITREIPRYSRTCDHYSFRKCWLWCGASKSDIKYHGTRGGKETNKWTNIFKRNVCDK